MLYFHCRGVPTTLATASGSASAARLYLFKTMIKCLLMLFYCTITYLFSQPLLVEQPITMACPQRPPQVDIHFYYTTKRLFSGKAQVKIWLKISERLCCIKSIRLLGIFQSLSDDEPLFRAISTNAIYYTCGKAGYCGGLVNGADLAFRFFPTDDRIPCTTKSSPTLHRSTLFLSPGFPPRAV